MDTEAAGTKALSRSILPNTVAQGNWLEPVPLITAVPTVHDTVFVLFHTPSGLFPASSLPSLILIPSSFYFLIATLHRLITL